MAHRRRPWLAPVLLLSLTTGAGFVAPACRVGYQELDGVTAGLDGGEPNNAAGQSAAVAGTGAAPGDGGAPSSGGSTGLGGSDAGGSSDTTGGSAVTVAGAGGDGGRGPTAPACSSSADCTCDELNGHSYWFCTQQLNWNDANAHCQTANMTLVRVDRPGENDFLLTQGSAHGVFFLPLNYAHIGASDQAVAGEWRWVDGTLFWQGGATGTLVKGMYANWTGKSPSDMGIQECSGILSSGLWEDRSCTALAPFICESP